MENNYLIVFDIIEAVSIDFENENQDFESDINENWLSFIEPNFFSKLPLELKEQQIFEIDGVANNLRLIFNSKLSAKDISSNFKELIINFYNEPWEYKIGSQMFEFAQLKPGKSSSEVLNNSQRLEELSDSLLEIYRAYDF